MSESASHLHSAFLVPQYFTLDVESELRKLPRYNDGGYDSLDNESNWENLLECCIELYTMRDNYDARLAEQVLVDMCREGNKFAYLHLSNLHLSRYPKFNSDPDLGSKYARIAASYTREKRALENYLKCVENGVFCKKDEDLARKLKSMLNANDDERLSMSVVDDESFIDKFVQRLLSEKHVIHTIDEIGDIIEPIVNDVRAKLYESSDASKESEELEDVSKESHISEDVMKVSSESNNVSVESCESPEKEENYEELYDKVTPRVEVPHLSDREIELKAREDEFLASERRSYDELRRQSEERRRSNEEKLRNLSRERIERGKELYNLIEKEREARRREAEELTRAAHERLERLKEFKDIMIQDTESSKRKEIDDMIRRYRTSIKLAVEETRRQ